MSTIIRNTGPRGPRFYVDGEALRFVNVVDASTRDGPRDATEEDQAAYPQAYAAFERGDESTFPGAAPMITFSGKRPAGVPDPALLAQAPPPREEPVEAASRKTLHLKTEAS